MSALLEIRDLTISFFGGLVTVGPVSLDIRAGEIFGLVGESGGGKSTISKAVLNDLPGAARVSRGEMVFDGRQLRCGDERLWRGLRWKELAYVPQSALNALNPVRRISAQFADLVKDHQGSGVTADWHRRIVEVLEAVRLPSDVLHKFPHELSGGMRQRVCIAMAVLFHPRLVIADEPTSALDVVSQRIVLQTLMNVRKTFGTALLLIGHDLAIMAQVADRVGILFSGQLVESGPVTAIFRNPAHPYTRRLLESVPSIRVRSGIPDVSLPTEAERLAWQDREIPLKDIGLDHQARVA